MACRRRSGEEAGWCGITQGEKLRIGELGIDVFATGETCGTSVTVTVDGLGAADLLCDRGVVGTLNRGTELLALAGLDGNDSWRDGDRQGGPCGSGNAADYLAPKRSGAGFLAPSIYGSAKRTGGLTSSCQREFDRQESRS